MNDDLKPCFSGETMLMGWGESDVQGPWIKLRLLDAEALTPFRGMTKARGDRAGQRLACVLVEVQDDESPGRWTQEQEDTAREVGATRLKAAQAGRHPNELARRLHVDGYFRNPKLWDAMEASAVYTQVQHKAWIESLACTFNPELSSVGLPLVGIPADRAGALYCAGDIVLHHCNSAAIPAAGKGKNPRKPPHWYGVPLCAINHHQLWVHSGTGADREDKQALLEHAIALTAERMKFHMKRWLGIESLKELTPEMLATFERGIGL